MISVPSAQDIEDEKFDFDFSVIFITEADMDKVKAAVMNVSEIENCYIAPIELEEVKQDEVPAVEEKVSSTACNRSDTG